MRYISVSLIDMSYKKYVYFLSYGVLKYKY